MEGRVADPDDKPSKPDKHARRERPQHGEEMARLFKDIEDDGAGPKREN